MSGYNEQSRNPQRQCCLTRDVLPTQELLRLCVGPEDSLVPDLKENLPGRGVWVKLSRASVDMAIEKRAFGRSLKTKVEVDPELGALIDRLLAYNVLSRLGLARKAGQLVLGAGKVEGGLLNHSIRLRILASDAAKDSGRKMAAKQASANRIYEEGEAGEDDKIVQESGPALIETFTVEQLSVALGAENVIHAGVTKSAAAKSIEESWKRLETYRNT